MVIYKTTNKINGKIYIGKDKYNKDSYYGSGLIIKQALKKYGKSNFQKEILFESDNINEINDMEKYYIKHFNSQNHDIGYNITSGGDGGLDSFTFHPNREQLLANRTGEKNSFYGKKHSNETKMKISKSNSGKTHSVEVRLKISNTLKEKYKNGEILQNVSSEERKRRSERMKTNNPYFNEKTKKKLSNTISGSGNPSAKTWIFENINGDYIEITGNFQKFCNDNDLSIKIMRNIADNIRKNKFYNGWTVKRKE